MYYSVEMTFIISILLDIRYKIFYSNRCALFINNSAVMLPKDVTIMIVGFFSDSQALTKINRQNNIVFGIIIFMDD